MIYALMLTLLLALIGYFFGGMKFDLFGFLVTKVNWYVFVGNIKFRRRNVHLFFLGRDPIGWRFDFLFMDFNKKYDYDYGQIANKINQGGMPVSKQELKKSFTQRVKETQRKINAE